MHRSGDIHQFLAVPGGKPDGLSHSVTSAPWRALILISTRCSGNIWQVQQLGRTTPAIAIANAGGSAATAAVDPP
jgi:hypothetical protein